MALSTPFTRSRNRPTKLFASSWQHYQKKDPLQHNFERDGGILYKTSVFTPKELTIIQEEVGKMITKDETSSSVARNRSGAVLPSDSDTIRILREGSLITTVIPKLVGSSSHALSTEVPVELRVYEKQGAGMDWHVDDVLFDPPQLEVVITLENTSDCQTMWKKLQHSDGGEDSTSGSDGSSIEVVETDVNSALILRAGGVSHCVSSLKRGRRAILKCVYVDKEAVFRKGEMVTQFGSSIKMRKKSKKR
eukprot:CAMPEP_0119032402 /NCGR_PEP_ID=MMETSP1176-20130426/42035_1 /TAXON_ID=265551 /ORGANISM="Synedropsis recta cf, Strain CCMP1620" /LENGTH=248 /DNA_ID=CAMNT_0006988815 /DNA_START=165 /DNA_END=911 /DNA_ORIENTATION=+